MAGCGANSVTHDLPPGNTVPTTAALAVAARTQLTVNIKVVPNASIPNGALVQVYTSPRASNPNAVATAALDLTTVSSACTATTNGTRTCAVAVAAPYGLDDIVVTTYDQAPAAGTAVIPSGAHTIGSAAFTQSIGSNSGSTAAVATGGSIASLTLTPATTSLPAGVAASVPLTYTARDSDGNALAIATFDTPITATINESGGGGHVALAAGGNAASSQALITQSTQTLGLQYDGGGSSGYSAQIALAAGNVTSTAVTIAPFFVGSLSNAYANGKIVFTQPQASATITLAEANFTGTFTAAVPPACASVVTVGAPTPGATSSSVLTAGTTPGTSCILTFSDGTVSVPITVSLKGTAPSPSPSPSSSPSPAATAASSAAPNPAPSASPSASPGVTIYVANQGGGFPGSILVFAPQSTGTQNIAPTATIAGASTGFAGNGAPSGIALDANGVIYVCSYSANTISTFAAAPAGLLNEAPIATIGGSNSGLNFPYSLNLDAAANIYTASYYVGISVFAPNPAGATNVRPTAVLAGAKTDLDGPTSVAMDAANTVYVANSGSNTITVYSPHPSGNEAPVATIAGDKTGLSGVHAIALDAAGRIYVANGNTNSITVYAANPTGSQNVAPVATIAGSNTGLNVPWGLALDRTGTIYVANAGNNSITVYAPNPTGTVNAAPIMTIVGTNTQLSNPLGLAVR